ncbi:hypothetical protein A2313_02735 [Candidatus Roizmanbacteria bacterium RIFOXYB2_FULL_41_10]|uniref:Glycosyl transferase family 1 domain-containing protein n=1 Tax=Candidatus Roizmanbacteria bacterium RIFOXYA1_FULL_41_12 TaxID=1802082 RepID=A0A1F7KAW2_9BACT|nr:MAG: hypothetical protein A2209_04885 [Candidatus Roizmanbacteria bacterium RIFOXYA1_FULL_41_12]OGK66742.1 MAG: hypothetical protein A2377_02435 [Candidatus Roizmanbacteria bacterium RIFOXYB1_FULL_41_27]OGK67222.1 MAG: hypothetical protein A2262_03245 [Candidatus Roizmanbacteria bacterium RIFOXYA2_FULL_41_8]OGK70654.1 MAG: hypothetical protein A2313_02735 [Candidatus Roizmanbacteria bacterium RIFOXYB2_FULL_41_10]OGK70884.1 MAG: hypothetical protein A2403_02275 [Candidatus Roizmanbacteria bac
MSEKLRVAIISSLTGGLGHYNAHLAEPLSKHCFPKFITYPQLDLLGMPTKRITDAFVRSKIKWPRFDIRENNPESIIEIVDYVKKHGIKVINIHIGTTVKRKISYFMTFLKYAKENSNLKFVFTLHDVFPFDEDRKLTKLLASFYSMADHLTVGNEFEHKKLIRYFKIPERKISIIPHGIYDLFDNNTYSKNLSRSYLGIPSNVNSLLFFGFLREYKGFDYLIKAAKILKQKKQNFVVYVASGLKYTPRDLVKKYLKMIKKLGLEDRFILNLNYLDTSDVEAVFKASDLVVLPYTHASQSGVMMMAFGFKKPVIITDTFADKHWVNNKAGLVAKSKDSSDLAKKISLMLKDKEQLIKMGAYGYKYSEDNLNWDKIAKMYFDVYKKLH